MMTATFCERALIHEVTLRIEALSCSTMFREVHFDITLQQQVVPVLKSYSSTDKLDSRWMLTSRPGSFTPTKSTLVLIERRLGVLRSHSGRLGDLKKKIRCLCRDSNPPVQGQIQSISCRRH